LIISGQLSPELHEAVAEAINMTGLNEPGEIEIPLKNGSKRS